jgi:hypothetical protein
VSDVENHSADKTDPVFDQTMWLSPWSRPSPPGLAAALESTFTIAGPILAGFASAIVVLVAPAPGTLPAGWLILDLGILSIGSLLVAIQMSFHAKAAWTSPQDLLDWYPLARIEPEVLEEVRRKHHGFAEQWAWYPRPGPRGGHAGLLSFLATVALVAAPPETPRILPDLPLAHYLPVLLGACFLLFEGTWIMSLASPRWPGRRLFVAPPPSLTIPPAHPLFSPKLYQ